MSISQSSDVPVLAGGFISLGTVIRPTGWSSSCVACCCCCAIDSSHALPCIAHRTHRHEFSQNQDCVHHWSSLLGNSPTRNAHGNGHEQYVPTSILIYLAIMLCGCARSFIATHLHLPNCAVARLNFSHGDHNGHAATLDRIRQAANNKMRNVAIMLDTKGPEIRSGYFVNDAKKIHLVKGETLVLTTVRLCATIYMENNRDSSTHKPHSRPSTHTILPFNKTGLFLQGRCEKIGLLVRGLGQVGQARQSNLGGRWQSRTDGPEYRRGTG